MSLQVTRPDHITTQFIAAPVSPTRHLPSARETLGVALRGLLVGIGIALVLIAGNSGGAVLAAGLLALGAALLGWSE